MAFLMANACAPSRDAKGPLVLAASSLQDALGEVSDTWTSQGHAAPVLSFAGTAALARQVEAGAPADLFISADTKWMERLSQGGAIRESTRKPLLINRLILIAPANGHASVDIHSNGKLLDALGNGRLAIADPEAVPAGRYARESLVSLGAWDEIESRIVPTENVRLALALVARGEVALGIVYETDALAEPDVRVAAKFPESSHSPIVYPAAILTASRHDEALAFLDFLSSPEASAIFRRHGFGTETGK